MDQLQAVLGLGYRDVGGGTWSKPAPSCSWGVVPVHPECPGQPGALRARLGLKGTPPAKGLHWAVPLEGGIEKSTQSMD